MKIYQTEIVNKSSTGISISEGLDGAGMLYDINYKKKVVVETTDKKNYLAPYERIVITGRDARTVRLKGHKRRGWIDPFKDSPTRIEMCNLAGRFFSETIFVQPGESYYLYRGLIVVCDLQRDTWLEKYQKLTIEEPYIRKIPSNQYPGEITLQQVPHTEYVMRSDEAIEAIRKRKEEEKDKIRV
jgi:hypothetical protein